MVVSIVESSFSHLRRQCTSTARCYGHLPLGRGLSRGIFFLSLENLEEVAGEREAL